MTSTEMSEATRRTCWLKKGVRFAPLRPTIARGETAEKGLYDSRPMPPPDAPPPYLSHPGCLRLICKDVVHSRRYCAYCPLGIRDRFIRGAGLDPPVSHGGARTRDLRNREAVAHRPQALTARRHERPPQIKFPSSKIRRHAPESARGIRRASSASRSSAHVRSSS